MGTETEIIQEALASTNEEVIEILKILMLGRAAIYDDIKNQQSKNASEKNT